MTETQVSSSSSSSEDDIVYCVHVFKYGIRKGLRCGRECLIVGSDLCYEHKKRFCPHGRRRYNCKEGCGTSICIHHKIKYKCTECWEYY